MTVTAPAERLQLLGAPILPGGTEPHIRNMVSGGRFYIADVPGYGMAVASPHWIAPADTVAPVLERAGLTAEPGTYWATGPGKVERTEGHPPMMADLVDQALAADAPVDHVLLQGRRGLIEMGETTCYVLDTGAGVNATWLRWLTGDARPERDVAAPGELFTPPAIYRIRGQDDPHKPMALWVEQWGRAAYVDGKSVSSVIRRTCFVVMPVRIGTT